MCRGRPTTRRTRRRTADGDPVRGPDLISVVVDPLVYARTASALTGSFPIHMGAIRAVAWL